MYVYRKLTNYQCVEHVACMCIMPLEYIVPQLLNATIRE